MRFRGSLIAAVLAATLPLLSAWAEPLQAVPAVQASNATQATMLDAVWAGERVVAVGDHGVVLLSDDQGKRFRQARSVPVSTQLTGCPSWTPSVAGRLAIGARSWPPPTVASRGRSSACPATKIGRCSPYISSTPNRALPWGCGRCC